MTWSLEENQTFLILSMLDRKSACPFGPPKYNSYTFLPARKRNFTGPRPAGQCPVHVHLPYSLSPCDYSDCTVTVVTCIDYCFSHFLLLKKTLAIYAHRLELHVDQHIWRFHGLFYIFTEIFYCWPRLLARFVDHAFG